MRSARVRSGVLFFVAASCALFGATAHAQEDSSPLRLYANPSFYAGGARANSLGGAWLAVAEGASYTSNHASFAQPSPWKGDWWSVDLTVQAITSAGGQDLDNDGVVDGTSTVFGLFGVAAQVGPVGLGVYTRTSALDMCLPPDCVGRIPVSFGNSGVALSGAFLDEQLVGAIGLETLNVRLGKEGVVRPFSGSALTFDLLFRPTHKPFRLAASLRPEANATLDSKTTGPATAFARTPPSAAVSPQVLSLGMAAKLDKGGEDWNTRRERADDPTAPLTANELIRDIFRTRKEIPAGRWLVTAQLDMTFPEKNAVQLDYFVQDAPPIRVGNRLLLTPRLGFEHVTAPGRLRLRAGSWLEPSPWSNRDARLHATAGFDLFLFHLLFDWGLTGSVDVASKVQQGGISFGVWH